MFNLRPEDWKKHLIIRRVLHMTPVLRYRVTYQFALDAVEHLALCAVHVWDNFLAFLAWITYP